MTFWLAIAYPVAVALAIACSFQPALGLPKGRRLAVLVVIELLVLLTPLLVAPDRKLARLLAGVLAVALGAKLFDLHIGASLGDRPGFLDVFTYLINLTSVVHRKLADEPRPGFGANLRRLGLVTLASMPGGLLFVACYRVDWQNVPFAVENAAKVFAFFLLLVPAGAAGAAIWRLMGGWTREPMDNPFASTTPADFWRRYNRPAQQFLLEDVFKPLGGMRRPILGTLATFAVSGLIHEFLFDITVWRIQGYQIAFFLIQGIAVVLTVRSNPKGWRRGGGIVATLAFMLATGALFFASIDEVLPFYQRR
jgi:MBOAT, membrane-bound O-acyltransferase family